MVEKQNRRRGKMIEFNRTRYVVVTGQALGLDLEIFHT